MRHHLFTRLAVCAAVAGSASLAAAVVPGGIASATPLSVTCTTMSGTATTQAISGCTGTGAIAADAGTAPAKGTQTTSTKTIKWSNAKTSVLTYTYKSVTNNCVAPAGYSKFLKESESGKVSGGTATGMVGSLVTGSVCVFKKTVGGTILVKNQGTFKI